MKSVWITYYELSALIGDKSAEEFEKAVNRAFSELYDMGFNTVTVHVRPCADAFYFSQYYPSSKYCFGQQGGDMPYDPLSILCTQAKNNNLRIEAWINPYRVSQDSNIDALCDSALLVLSEQASQRLSKNLWIHLLFQIFKVNFKKKEQEMNCHSHQQAEQL